MASATITLLNLADENVVYTLAGQTDKGALYKDATRSLGLPRTLEFNYQVGSPGARGNDKLIITLKDAVANADTTGSSVATVKVEFSVPRDSSWTDTFSSDILCQLASLLSDTRIANICDAIVP